MAKAFLVKLDQHKGVLAAKKRLLSKVSMQVLTLWMVLASCGQGVVSSAQMSDDITKSLSTGLDATSTSQSIDVSGSMKAAIQAAVQSNEAYLAALSLEAEALAQIGVANSTRRPQLQANTVAGGIRESGAGQDNETFGVSGGLSLSQLIYDGGESAATINRATAEAIAARAERDMRGNELALEATRAWIDVWQYSARLALLTERTSQMNTVVSQIERMASNGMVDRASLDSARRQIVDISLEETGLRAELNQAKVRFIRFFNHAPSALKRPPELVSAVAALSHAKAWKSSPSLQRSAAELIIAQNAVIGARSAFKPKARLQAGINAPMEDGDSTDTTVGFAIEYTFGDGGRRQSLLEAAQARVKTVEAQMADAQRVLRSELDVAKSQLEAIDRSIPLVARQITLSASEAETARSQLATAQSNLREVIGAEMENYRATDRKIAMQAEKMVIQVTMASRTGALGELLNLNDAPSR